MKKMLRSLEVLWIALLIFFLSSLAVQASVLKVSHVSPDHIDIGAFYHGIKLKVTGFVPADSDIVIRFVGVRKDVHLKRKGKVLGLLWMNVDPVTFKMAPNACIVEASSKYGLKMLGLKSLESDIEIETEASVDRERLFLEFLKLKKSEKLYSERVGSVRFEEVDETKKGFSVDLVVPARLTPGKYTLQIFAIRDGQVVDRAEQVIPVKLVGFPAFLASMAFNHGGWYGVLAVVIAIFAGLAMGFIFGGKGGAH